jgi:hypothetical protein
MLTSLFALAAGAVQRAEGCPGVVQRVMRPEFLRDLLRQLYDEEPGTQASVAAMLHGVAACGPEGPRALVLASCALPLVTIAKSGRLCSDAR